MTPDETARLDDLCAQVQALKAHNEAESRRPVGVQVVVAQGSAPAVVLAAIELVLSTGRAIVGVRKFGGWSADGFEPFATRKPLEFETLGPGDSAAGESEDDGDEWKREAPPVDASAPMVPHGYHLLTVPIRLDDREKIAREYAAMSGCEEG